MKYKNLLLLCLYFGCTTISGQFTMTEASHGPTVGTVSFSRYDSAFSGLPRIKGSNCNWNFSNLKLNAKNYSQSTSVLASSVPASSLFPEATIAGVGGSDYYSFVKSTSNKSEWLGYYSGGEEYHCTNTWVNFEWPLDYSTNTSFTDNYVLAYPVSAGSDTRVGQSTTSVTGFGTLTIPGGRTFNNVLKLQTVDTYSLFDKYSVLTETTVMYTDAYFAPEYHNPILNVMFVYFQAGPNTIKGSQIVIQEDLTAGMSESTLDHQFILYPNPANEKVKINFSNKNTDYCIQLYNNEGKLVKELTSSGSTVPNNEVPIDDLPPGIYLVSVQSANGRMTKKLIVQ